MKNKVIFTAVIIFITFIIVTGLIFMLITQIDQNLETANLNEDNWIVEIIEPRIEKPVISKSILHSQIPSANPSATPYMINIPIPTATSPINNFGNKNAYFASIKIKTSKRTRTYEIMPDVKESTLKKNIGWLPSSSLPNQDGLCILMGHRDTDFSILQYVEIGDELIIHMNDTEYNYSVSAIKIVNSDNKLRFEADNDSTLVLITCYPFRYSGHAPQKFIVSAE